MTLQDAQKEAYYAYDPASGIPEEQFTMEFIKGKYPQLIKPKVPVQAPTNMLQGALAPQAPIDPQQVQQVQQVPGRVQGILSQGYLQPVAKKKKLKDKIKGALLPDGWDVEGGSITTPSGLSFGKNKLGYTKKF